MNRLKKNIEQSPLHARNKHRDAYDFKALARTTPELTPYLLINKYGLESIDFFNPAAVKTLNKALLLHYYGLTYWDIPPDYLCPPIPGRADYIHYMADALARYHRGKIPLGKKITAWDIGVGANAVYPIIGIKEYGWSFIGSDVHIPSLASAQRIIDLNPSLQGKLELRTQTNPELIFKGILQSDEFIDVVVCNPPFHDSKQVAKKGTLRKLKNLKAEVDPIPVLNFGGQDNELWRKGGELKFALDMILESRALATSFLLFSIFISKEDHIKSIHAALQKVKALDVRVIIMGQGQKRSRAITWTYLTPQQIQLWSKSKTG